MRLLAHPSTRSAANRLSRLAFLLGHYKPPQRQIAAELAPVEHRRSHARTGKMKLPQVIAQAGLGVVEAAARQRQRRR